MNSQKKRRLLSHTANPNRRYNRFLADGTEPKKEEKQLWNLPLLYSTASNPKQTQLEMMSGETHTIKARCREFAVSWGAFWSGNGDDGEVAIF